MLFSPDNDFSPVLDQTAYVGALDENSDVGSTVLTFSVTDGDRSGPAAEIGEATIVGDDAEFFRVNITSPTTGIITST